MRPLALLLLMSCLTGDAIAGSCGTKSRVRQKHVHLNTDAVFAVPVGTIVVLSPPALLYSYREALGSSTMASVPSTATAPTGQSLTAEAILRAHCAKCHQGDMSRSGLAFFSGAGELLAPLPRRAMLEMASPDANGSVRMPPGDAPKLSAEELKVIRAWAEPPRGLRY